MKKKRPAAAYKYSLTFDQGAAFKRFGELW